MIPYYLVMGVYLNLTVCDIYACVFVKIWHGTVRKFFSVAVPGMRKFRFWFRFVR